MLKGLTEVLSKANGKLALPFLFGATKEKAERSVTPAPSTASEAGIAAPKPAPKTPPVPADFGSKVQGAPQRDVPRMDGRQVIRRREADEEMIAELLKWDGDVPTAPGGVIETTEEQRLHCAYLGNGTMLVTKLDPLNPQVMQVRYALRRANRPIRIEYLVELDIIRKIYEATERRTGGARSRAGTTEMQAEFLKLISEAAGRRCSDIHVKVERYEAEVRVRADGVMQHLRQLPAAFASDLCAAAFNMADASDSSYRPYEYQGARVSDVNQPLPDGVQAVRLQFNPLPNGGRYMICRLLYASSDAADSGDIDTLGYNKVHVEQIKRMRKKTFGINVVSGPTGSGKSTTLQRALSALMREKRGTINVITIEDPPEYVIAGAAQLPVTNAATDEERNEKFRQAISASLRSDPNIIMIGEIRDRASSALAFAAAMTGHQVWASLHANDSISILDRFRDQEVDDYKLSDHTLVTGLIGQRLIRRLCEKCKIPFHEANANGVIDYELAEEVIRITGDRSAEVFVANECGCDHCRGGYSGRVVIAECIVPDQVFMEHIRRRDKDGAVKYWLSQLDGLTMLEHAVQKMVKGWADPRDVEDTAGMLSEFDIERRKEVFGRLFH